MTEHLNRGASVPSSPRLSEVGYGAREYCLRILCSIVLASAALLTSLAYADSTLSVDLASQGYFFVGGHYIDAKDGRFMFGQMYVRFQIPRRQTHPYPIVMFSGGGQSGLNYEGTPDGREGWAQYFLQQGYAVYVIDQPARARSPYYPDDAGPMVRNPVEFVETRFTAPEHFNLWPQAKLHTQWPGSGMEGDPTFDQFMAQQYPGLASFPRQQELNRDAGAALLDKIGAAIVLTHSQSGAFGWLIADSRPALVKAIVALEPSGPPVHDLIDKGAPTWFEDGPLTKPYGLAAAPLTYSPPLQSNEQLKFVKRERANAPDLAVCWEQAAPARSLANLQNIPMLVVQTEASYHAAYDYCTVGYLHQAGVEKMTYIHLAEIGIHGNGHMMMLEKNNLEIAGVVAKWLGKTLPSR